MLQKLKENKYLFAFYLCTAVGGFFIFGGLAAGSISYISLGAFNLIVAYFLGKKGKNLKNCNQ